MFCCKLVMGKIHTNISDIIDSLTFINDGIIDVLITADQAERLKAAGGE